MEAEGLDKRSYSWQKVDAEDAAPNFPRCSEDEIRALTLGVYQVKLAKSYTQEHLDADGGYEMFVSNDVENMICAKIQSRHTSSKQYKCWIGYDQGVITSWYCKCKCGARVVGTCAHFTSVIWYLSCARYNDSSVAGMRNWTETLEDASILPDIIDYSDSDEFPEE